MTKIYITPEEEQEYLAYHSFEDVLRNLKSGSEIVKQFVCPFPKRKAVLICGAMAAFDKGIIDFLNFWNKQMPELNMVLLSEVTAQYRRYTAERVEFPFLCTPHLLAKEMIIRNMDIPVTKDILRLTKKKKYLMEAVLNLKGRYPDLGINYAENWAYYAYLFIEALLEKVNPGIVVLWNEFYAFHHILSGICKEKKIPIKYMEFGCLPGTFCIEGIGQQGESLPARNYFSFQRLPVTPEERKQAECVIEYMRKTGINRNIQPRTEVQTNLLKFWKAGRRSITFFGQNLYESGMFPYTYSSRKFHSPVFHSDLEALQFLRLLCIKNDWNMLYKPHPIIRDLGLDKRNNLVGCDVQDDINLNSIIDFTNVSVTIVSQCAYISLIRKRPVVMLGYTQLRGKKCTYEAFKRGRIEKTLINALKNGYTAIQEENFKNHCAQLLKYYLFDDLTDREFRYGIDIRKMKMDRQMVYYTLQK